jgi:hypothetical protein
MSQRNYYQTLGAPASAAQKEITRAYRRRARQFHPDLQPPERKQWAVKQMQQLNEAYAVLSDPAQRARYDALNGLQPPPPPPRQPRYSSRPQGDWFDNLSFHTYGRVKSRRWRRYMLLADFVFWMLVFYFLLIGAYLIFFEWQLVFNWVSLIDLQHKSGIEAQHIRLQLIFAAFWYAVLAFTVLKNFPKRR